MYLRRISLCAQAAPFRDYAKKICKIMDNVQNSAPSSIGINDSSGAHIQEGGQPHGLRRIPAQHRRASCRKSA
jgi:acetyl-CoA carboxylase carboxyltransferase component